MSRILIIEDEPKVMRGLERGLRAEGYEVATAATGAEGSKLAHAEPFDGIVLDWMLPDHDGIQILADLRRAGKTVPVLLLTSRDAIEDRVIGLDSGADDYLIKPFAFAELLARLRVLFRRGQVDRETCLRAADLELDLLTRRARRDGVEVVLTQREFEVLEYLVRHKNEPVTRDMLGREVWNDPNYSLTNVIEVFINLLRRKLDAPGRTPLIVTMRGVGYCLKE